MTENLGNPLDDIDRVVSEMFADGYRMRVSIPVRPDQDHDVRLADAVAWARRRIAELEARLRVPCAGCPGCGTDDCAGADDCLRVARERIAELQAAVAERDGRIASMQRVTDQDGRVAELFSLVDEMLAEWQFAEWFQNFRRARVPNARLFGWLRRRARLGDATQNVTRCDAEPADTAPADPAETRADAGLAGDPPPGADAGGSVGDSDPNAPECRRTAPSECQFEFEDGPKIGGLVRSSSARAVHARTALANRTTCGLPLGGRGVTWVQGIDPIAVTCGLCRLMTGLDRPAEGESGCG